jgi:lipoprotein signal peptidase
MDYVIYVLVTTILIVLPQMIKRVIVVNYEKETNSSVSKSGTRQLF